MAIAPVLKTGARKGLGVRIPHPPSTVYRVPSAGGKQVSNAYAQKEIDTRNDKRPAP
jgi:hypothetical protein